MCLLPAQPTRAPAGRPRRGSLTLAAIPTTSNSRGGPSRSPAIIFGSRRWATSPSPSGPIGGTHAREPICERPLKMRTQPARTSGSAARRQPPVGSPETRARGPVASTRTSTATERHSDRRERERAGGVSSHRPLALQPLAQPDRELGSVDIETPDEIVPSGGLLALTLLAE